MDNRYKKFPFIGRKEILDAENFRPNGAKFSAEDGNIWVSNGKEWIEVEE